MNQVTALAQMQYMFKTVLDVISEEVNIEITKENGKILKELAILLNGVRSAFMQVSRVAPADYLRIVWLVCDFPELLFVINYRLEQAGLEILPEKPHIGLLNWSVQDDDLIIYERKES